MCLSQFVSFHPSQPFVSLLDFIGHAQSMVADCNHYGLKCFEFCLSKTSNLKGHWGFKKNHTASLKFKKASDMYPILTGHLTKSVF